MNYNLKFHKKALKEWRKLTTPIKEQLKKKLKERLNRPRVQADKLRGSINRYKIKLKSSGYRLVYEVNDAEVSVIVIVINNRDTVYNIANKR